MKLHYSLDSAVVLHEVIGHQTILNLKNTGVSNVWLWGYSFGKLWTPINEMVQAKEILENNGFEVGVIQSPAGHPDNGANPANPILDLKIPSHWRCRVDLKGNPVNFCADIEPEMIKDNKKSIETLQKAGFTSFFMDDDLRLGNNGSQIGGCFCDKCIDNFNKIYAQTLTREKIEGPIDSKKSIELIEEWAHFNCSKVIDFLNTMQLPGTQVGLMPMFMGDERHGIDFYSIKKECKNIFFRAGGNHFDDKNFEKPINKAEEISGLLFHLNMTGKENTFSETTAFPPENHNKENFLFKVKIAVALGLSNILLKSGALPITDNYWRFISENLPAIQKIEKSTSTQTRLFPMHIAKGTHGAYGEKLMPTVIPILAGMPAKFVRSRDLPSSAEVLFFLGDYEFNREWQNKVSCYKKIYFDKTSFGRNKKVLHALQLNNIGFMEDNLTVEILRQKVKKNNFIIPMIATGENIALFWLKESNSVVLLNLQNSPNKGVLTYDKMEIQVSMKSLELTLIPLDSIVTDFLTC